jgi:hypothetical protein
MENSIAVAELHQKVNEEITGFYLVAEKELRMARTTSISG